MDPIEETADPSNPNPNPNPNVGEEMELSLALSLGTRATVNPTRFEEPFAGGSSGGSSGAASGKSSPLASSLTTAEARSVSEMRRFRRLEAKMKQEEKRKRREIFQRLTRTLTSYRSSVGSGFPEARAREGEAREAIGPGMEWRSYGVNGGGDYGVLPPFPASNPNLNPNPDANPGAIPVAIVNPNLARYSIPAIPVIPMQVPYNQVQYVPAVNAFGYHCMVPCWPPAIPPAVADGQNRTAGSNVVMPLPVRAMPAAPLPTPLLDRDDRVVAAGSSAFRQVPPWPPLSVGSSSAVTEHQSSSQHGTSSSSNTKIRSSHIEAPEPQRQPSPVPEQLPQVTSNHSLTPSQNAPSSAHAAPGGEGLREEKDKANMPLVAVRGDGSNGSTVFGFLSKSSGNGLVILCACHDRSFSPAGFLKHAGAPETEEPLRHIMVNTSKASKM